MYQKSEQEYTMSENHQVILLAHGSSDPQWCQTFEQLAKPTLEAIPESAIAYMELAEPSLDTAVARAVRKGAKLITVVPLFLAAGRHLRKDVPVMINRLASQHQVRICLAPPIGQHLALGLAVREVVSDTLATQSLMPEAITS